MVHPSGFRGTLRPLIPSGIFLAYYSNVRIVYVAGFSQANIPPVIKQVTAKTISAGLNAQNMAGGIKAAKAGDTMLQRFEKPCSTPAASNSFTWYKARRFVRCRFYIRARYRDAAVSKQHVPRVRGWRAVPSVPRMVHTAGANGGNQPQFR
jgi:hypothetical protein